MLLLSRLAVQKFVGFRPQSLNRTKDIHKSLVFMQFFWSLNSNLQVVRYYTLHYYLADDTVEMLENLPRTGQRSSKDKLSDMKWHEKWCRLRAFFRLFIHNFRNMIHRTSVFKKLVQGAYSRHRLRCKTCSRNMLKKAFMKPFQYACAKTMQETSRHLFKTESFSRPHQVCQFFMQLYMCILWL